MPTTPKTSNRRGHEAEKSRKNKLKEKAFSFHGRAPVDVAPEARTRRISTLPDLFGGRSLSAGAIAYAEARPKLTKLLLNVTVQGSIGTVQVVMSPESNVCELIAATIRQYNKEGRRPILAADASRFNLHYSQFSLESLDKDEKISELGSRSYFLCAKKLAIGGDDCSNGATETTSFASSCSNEVGKAVKTAGSPWLKFINFML